MFASANTAHFALSIPAIRNDFKVLAFEGIEAISTLYAIKIELVSEYPDFDVESLLSQPAFLQFGADGEGIHGRIEDVSAGETGKRLTHYQLTLVPALHYLQFSHNQRIFQHKTVPQIVAQVLNDHGIQADTYTFNVSTSVEREYCTQYLESDFQLIQRLCSEDGISWHHQHSPQGHQLVFTDGQTHFPKLGDTPYQQGAGLAADHPVISQFSQRVSTRTSAVTRRAYDFQRPSLLLESQSRTEFNPRLEDYRYPVEMDTLANGKLLAKQALERHRVDYLLAEGHSDQPTLRSGHFFGLVNHPRPRCNALWLLVSVSHEGKNPQALEEVITSDINPADGFTQGYRNRFSAIPWDVFYRPPLILRPSVLVSQTARVTGPEGEEIFCDEFGRVRCEFHWDRAELNSDKSSCWLRVSSSWAGPGYGAVTIPRIGMEVVVTFLEGNPDKPLITGIVASKVNSVPYSLPENKTKTVLRSKSSPDNGGYNELSIEDRAGQELIYLRAERDMEQKVENDSRLEVGNERHETIKGNSISVLEAEDQRTVTADRKVQLKANDYLKVSSSSHTHVGETLVIEAGQQVHIKSGENLILDAGASISLKGGGQHIVIGPGGIFSSTEIVIGGAPTAGTAANPLVPGVLAALLAPSALSPSQLPAAATDDVGLEEEEEEEELEEAPNNITLRVGVFFDGTGNNRANSESVYGCFAKDLGLEDAGKDIREFCAIHGYDGAGSAPDDSYGNDTSNVAKLYDLYKDQSFEVLESIATRANLRVYVEGIGTSSGAGDSLYGQGTGLGDTGVRARVEQAPTILFNAIQTFLDNNPSKRIESFEFDIFGFSRGAAAARDFANEVIKGEQSILATVIPKGTSGLADTFAWKPQQDVSINFIGLYDTVAAIADPFEGDFTGHDAINPGINLYLAPGIAKKVVHLVARDERRYNFSSNSAGSSDLRLPGVHSDLGGGYLPKAIERVLLSKPRSCEVGIGDSPETTTSYKLAKFDLESVQRQLARYDLPLSIRTWAVRFIHRAKGDVVEGKRVYAAVSSQREVRSDLALIYLRIMRKLAVQNDVPFDDIDEQEARTALPGELLPIADKLTAYALGQSKVIGLSASEEELLYHRYVHLSANWNAAKGLNNSEWDAVFINRPNLGLERTVHPNE